MNLFIKMTLVILISFTTSCFSTTDTNTSQAQDKLSSLQTPLKTYSAKQLEGLAYSTLEDEGRKLVFGFFDFRNKTALPMLKGLEKLSTYQSTHNFKIYAVSINAGESAAVQKFITDNQITLPVLIDNPNLDFAMSLKVENEVALVALNPKHEISFGLKMYPFAGRADGESLFLNFMKENLAIKSVHGAIPRLGIFPMAPDFSGKTLEGKFVSLKDYKGKAVVVLFFSPKCPHCHVEIAHFKEKIYPTYSKKGLEVLAVSVFKLDGEMFNAARALEMPWPVIDDGDRKIRKLYSNEMGVPENFFVDRTGRVRFHSVGFSPQHGDLLTMQLNALLDLPNPPLLSDKHYNGAESCMVCHADIYASWATTPHAHAFETLKIKGEDFNPECVGCHSLGMNDPKGYQVISDPQTQKQVASVPEPFQNVQCEHCHGIAGPHAPNSKPIKANDMKNSCLECHTDKFSLHFDFHERLKKVNHDDAARIAKLSEEERLVLLQKVSKAPQDLFGAGTKFTGSDSCLSCHSDTHKNWKTSVHGKVPNKKFETTAMQENLARENVGASCESCHGPGEKHITSKRKQDIRGLGDDCPFCVIEQICLSCHSADSGFNLKAGLNKINGHK